MPRGSKAKYTDKQKRQAEHIEEGYRKDGISKKTAEARAWATVNKQDGGGKKGGSGAGAAGSELRVLRQAAQPARNRTARTARTAKRSTSRSR